MAKELIEASAAAVALPASGIPPRRVKLLPMGQVNLRDGRGPYFIRDITHARRIVASTQAWLGSTDFNFDFDHSVNKVNAGAMGEAIAAGWAKASSLRAEPDGIYCDVEWTAAAAARIAAREYRYLSPLFLAANDTGDVTHIRNASLVNLGAIDLPAVAASHAGNVAAVGALGAAAPLTATELAVCASLGTSPADFQRFKAEEALIAAGLNMGGKTEEGQFYAWTIDELKALSRGGPAQIQVALTRKEQLTCQNLGWTFATYLQEKIRQLEAETVKVPAAHYAQNALSADELAVAAALGTSPADVLRYKRDEALFAADQAALSVDELAVCASLGTSPADFQRYKAEEALIAAAQAALSDVELAACRMTGTSPTDFLLHKKSEGRA